MKKSLKINELFEFYLRLHVQNVSISMVMTILNQKVNFALGYWIFVSIYLMGTANYVVFECYNSTTDE